MAAKTKYELVCRYCNRVIHRDAKGFSKAAYESFGRGSDIPAALCRQCIPLAGNIERTGLYGNFFDEAKQGDERQGG